MFLADTDVGEGYELEVKRFVAGEGVAGDLHSPLGERNETRYPTLPRVNG